MTRTSLLVAVTLIALPSVGRADDGASIRGRVTDHQGGPLANVEVIAQATTLPGRVTTRTAATGHYTLRALPDGEYVLTFQRENLVVHKITAAVAPGELASIDVALVAEGSASSKPAPIVVTIQDRQTFIRHPLIAVTYRRDRLEMLPLLGSAASALEPGPGAITASGFQPGVWLDDRPVTLAWPGRRGALPIDFGRASLAEITATRAGAPIDLAPAEGGAIQIAPRRGADQWNGSAQLVGGAAGAQADQFAGGRAATNALGTVEATLGGPIARGQTWFFTSFQTERTNFDDQTALIGAPFESRLRHETLFGRVTHQFGTQHRIDGSFSRVGAASRQALFSDWRVADVTAAATDDAVHAMWAARTSSQLGSSTFLELRATGEGISLDAPAQADTSLAAFTPVVDLPARMGFGAQRGCIGCDPGRRSVLTGRAVVHHLLGIGGQSHDLTAGYEVGRYRLRPAAETGARIEMLTSRTIVSGNVPVPVLIPNGSSAIAWFPSMDADLDGGSQAFFAGDRWRSIANLTVDAGVRVEWWRLTAPNGANVLNEWALSPRVQIAWEPPGTHEWRWTASFAQYASGLPWRTDDYSLALETAWRRSLYGGPSLNNAGADFTTAEALARAAQWFQSVGGVTQPSSAAIVPGITTVALERSAAPRTTEWATGLGGRLGRTELRTDVVLRSSGGLRGRTVTPGVFSVDESGQPVDTGTPGRLDRLWRKSAELTLQALYRAGIQGSGGIAYTLSRSWGTADGRLGDDPSQRLALGYPAYFDEAWAMPVGDLGADRRHRFQLWGVGQPIDNETLGRLSVGLLIRLESGTPYGAVGWIDTRPFVTNPGVQQPPAAVPYYFTARDAFRTETRSRADLSVQFTRQVPGLLRGEWFVRADLLNLFGSTAPLDPWRDVVVVTALQDPSRLATFNPFAQAPVEGVHWARDDRFPGDAGSRQTLGRSFRWLVGFRF